MAGLQNLVMPKLGLTMTEGLLAEWRVQPGQRVQQGDILFVVETEKIANEVEAPSDGVIGEILVTQGKVAPVGAVLARWTGAGSDAGTEAVPAAEAAPDLGEASVATPPASSKKCGSSASSSDRIVATPLARRLARQHGVDLQAVTGSGPRGRIKAQDILAAATERVSPLRPDAGQRRRATSYEATVAKRLTEAKRDVPHFYVASEADVGALLVLREELNRESGRTRISVNHMLIVALARAVAQTPAANRAWRGSEARKDGEIEEFASVDIGIAVDTERGLIVPVLRDLAAASLDDVATRAVELVERARRGALSLDETSGGAVTISNVGMHRVTYLTPIINPGQTAILGVGSVREAFRPDAGGAPVLRREIGLVIACDHRVLDGVTAAALLNRITSGLENPLNLLRTPAER